jgi:hypothetical protein
MLFQAFYLLSTSTDQSPYFCLNHSNVALRDFFTTWESRYQNYILKKVDENEH